MLSDAQLQYIGWATMAWGWGCALTLIRFIARPLGGMLGEFAAALTWPIFWPCYAVWRLVRRNAKERPHAASELTMCDAICASIEQEPDKWSMGIYTLHGPHGWSLGNYELHGHERDSVVRDWMNRGNV